MEGAVNASTAGRGGPIVVAGAGYAGLHVPLRLTAKLRDNPVVELTLVDRNAVNGWIGRLFHRDNLDGTVAALVASQNDGTSPNERQVAKGRLADAEARLRRFQAAIASGVDPAALVEAINEAQADRAAARAELANTPRPNALTDAEVYAMIDTLGSTRPAGSQGLHPEPPGMVFRTGTARGPLSHVLTPADIRS
jgi:hypothetical protein